MITSPFFGYYIFLPGTGTGCTWVVTTFVKTVSKDLSVSMPSRAWVVAAGMSNILNFLWYFLCIPAIYKCILAYLSIFFNQLSDFLRCESPNTFLGTCLSHHSFIILLITHGLIPHFYDHKSSRGLHGRTRVSMPLGLIPYFYPWQKTGAVCFCGNVSMPSRAYTSFLQSCIHW